MRIYKGIFASMCLMLVAPRPTGSPSFVHVSAPLSVSANKSHPPYLAFIDAEGLSVAPEWNEFERRIRNSSSEIQNTSPEVAAPVVELEIEHIASSEVLAPASTISLASHSPARPLNIAMVEPVEDTTWMEELTPSQRKRVELAQLKIEQEEVLPEAAPDIGPEWLADLKEMTKTAQKSSSVPATVSDMEIRGEIQIQGIEFGPSDRYIEVRRRHEGVDDEVGEVNIKDATYAIRLKNPTGRIIARVKDHEGRIWGEGSFHISQVRAQEGKTLGPKLLLAPTTGWGGTVSSVYGRSLPKDARAFAAGNIEATSEKDGSIEFQDIQKGSFAVLRAFAKDHPLSVALAVAGARPQLPIFSKSWVRSLKELVSEQRNMSLASEEAPILWGKVVQDGQSVAGVSVEVESEPGLEAIYFNQLLLPDPSLRTTSSNGLYAFIGVRPGFHALKARRGDAYLAHHNTVVEEGAVSVTEIATGLRTEQSPIRVFDALSGESRTATVTHQGAEASMNVNGVARFTLPVLSRMSLTRVEPEAPYARALYLSNDKDGYVHLPLVREDWIHAVRTWTRIDEPSHTSVVIGFSPDEDFQVEPQLEQQRIVYFDREGRPTNKDYGVAGGGFMLFSPSMDVSELKMTGLKTRTIAVRTFPLDASSVVVVSLRAN